MLSMSVIECNVASKMVVVAGELMLRGLVYGAQGSPTRVIWVHKLPSYPTKRKTKSSFLIKNKIVKNRGR